MMTVVLSLLFFAFYFIRTVRALCFHLAWWEIKEYRLDRMLVHLRETYQGRQWLLDPISLVKWFLLLSYFLVPSEFFPFKLFSVIVIAMYLIEGTFNIIELKNGWKIPPLRIRIGAIWFATLLILTLLLYIPFPRPVVFLLIDKAIGISIALFIFLTNVVFKLHKKQVMARARQKISRYKNLEVVGITGSYWFAFSGYASDQSTSN